MITYPRNPESTPQGKFMRSFERNADEREYGNARFLCKVMKKLQGINRTELAYSRVAAVV
jgi:hypothetical protein